MQLNIEKVGENYSLQIPPAFAKQCGFDTNSKVNVKLKSDRIIIETADQGFSTMTVKFWESEDNQNNSEIYYG